MADHTAFPDPLRLVNVLRRAGWSVIGYRTDAYIRLARSDGTRVLMIPLDLTAPEYTALLDAALADLADLAAAGAAAHTALTAYRAPTRPLADYVVGFLIDEHDRVLLVRKNRPDWQAGKLNGPGGKIEPGETAYAAMCREFVEEVGTPVDAWRPFLDVTCTNGHVQFFRRHVSGTLLAEVEERLRTVGAPTDEQVEVWPIATLLVPDAPTVPNLRWILPLAAHHHDRYHTIVVTEVEQDRTRYRTLTAQERGPQ